MSKSRREFIRKAALAAGGVSGLAALTEQAKGATPPPMPQRVLGRTKVKVSVVGLGMAPMGSDNTTAAEVEKLVGLALDLGINYVDVAPVYGNAESKLKGIVKARRDEMFLVTKVNPRLPDRAGVQKQLEESLQSMGADHVDAVHIHNLGDWDMEKLLKPDGPLAGLKEARKRGLTRHVAVSGHMRPGRFATLIGTGDIDLTMVALNFADRHNYDFEGLVLPAARAQRTAVVAMKVLGGSVAWRYDGKTEANLKDHYDRAIRYSLSLPGVSCAVVGVSNEKELRQLAAAGRGFKPLTDAERTALIAEGKKLAVAREQYYGPVTG